MQENKLVYTFETDISEEQLKEYFSMQKTKIEYSGVLKDGSIVKLSEKEAAQTLLYWQQTGQTQK